MAGSANLGCAGTAFFGAPKKLSLRSFSLSLYIVFGDSTPENIDGNYRCGHFYYRFTMFFQ